MNVLLIMEIVNTNVIILLVLTIAPAILDINCTLIDTIVQVITEVIIVNVCIYYVHM